MSTGGDPGPHTSLGVFLTGPHLEERLFARVKVPEFFPQWIPVPDEPGDGRAPGQSFARLLDVIRHNLDQLFAGMQVLEVMPFRITRSADVEQDEDEPPEDLVAMVEEELRQRRFERAVRLEYGPGGSPALLQIVARKLGLGEVDLYPLPAELDFTDLFPIAALNRTYALAKARSKADAIREAEKLNLAENHLYHSLLGELYLGIDDVKALGYFNAALGLAKSRADRLLLVEKIRKVGEVG